MDRRRKRHSAGGRVVAQPAPLVLGTLMLRGRGGTADAAVLNTAGATRAGANPAARTRLPESRGTLASIGRRGGRPRPPSDRNHVDAMIEATWRTTMSDESPGGIGGKDSLSVFVDPRRCIANGKCTYAEAGRSLQVRRVRLHAGEHRLVVAADRLHAGPQVRRRAPRARRLRRGEPAGEGGGRPALQDPCPGRRPRLRAERRSRSSAAASSGSRSTSRRSSRSSTRSMAPSPRRPSRSRSPSRRSSPRVTPDTERRRRGTVPRRRRSSRTAANWRRGHPTERAERSARAGYCQGRGTS